MNLNDQIPISRFEYKKLIVSVYSNSIWRVFVKPDAFLDIEDIKQVLDFSNALGPKMYLNLFEFSKHASIDESVRKWASDPEGNKRTIADAIVFNGLDQQLIADFYVKFNSPIKPTKLFSNLDEAVNWLLSFSVKES